MVRVPPRKPFAWAPGGWAGRNPAWYTEADIGTEGGMYGWDYTDGVDPIPAARIGAWTARCLVVESIEGTLGLG
jgi:hypothetical protein